MANVICVDEGTITQIETRRERLGTMESLSNSSDDIRRATVQAIRECKLSTELEEIRESCKGWYLYLTGILTREDRTRLIACIAAKTNKEKELFEIVAFYN